MNTKPLKFYKIQLMITPGVLVAEVFNFFIDVLVKILYKYIRINIYKYFMHGENVSKYNYNTQIAHKNLTE